MNSKLASLISIASNGLLMWTYLQALLVPSQHVSFYYFTGSIILLLEFLNLHSTGMTMGGKSGNFSMKANILGHVYESNKYDNKAKLALLGFYALFSMVFLLISGNYVVIFYFLVSLVSKIFLNQNAESKTAKIRYLLAFGVYIILTIFCFAMEWLIVLLFPLPLEVLAHKPGSSGLMVDSPQVFVVEGVIYFLLLIAIDIWYWNKE